MEAVRNFTSTNRGSIVNIVYVVAVVILAYYLFQFYMSSTEYDKDLVTEKMTPTKLETKLIYDTSSKSALQIKEGKEMTISLWYYFTSWNTMDKVQELFTIVDSGTGVSKHVVSGGLYSNEPKMVLRAGANKHITTGNPTLDITTGADVPACDVMEIDMQRWIHVTVTINGRIMDVYLDGKLARSCILADTLGKGSVSATGTQNLVLYPLAGASMANGYVGGVQYSSYTLTPDQIYSRYQSGPYASVGFLDYLWSKIGIDITYVGKKST
jgi:hypothetical protein